MSSASEPSISQPSAVPSGAPMRAKAGLYLFGCDQGRLRKHADYQRVYQATRKQFSNSMTWFVAQRPATCGQAKPETADPDGPDIPRANGPRVGLTAGKVLGKAHERNRIKRRMRELVRRHLHVLPAGVDLILHPRRSVMTMDFAKLDAEILRIFRQAAQQASQNVATPAMRAVRPKA